MKVSAGSSMGGPKPIKKSFAAKRVDKKLTGMPENNRERYYKIKAKSTDPGARLGIAKEVKVKEISKNQRDRLDAKSKSINKKAENAGRLDAAVKKDAGVDMVTRYKASTNAHQKSNLSLSGKITKATGGQPSTSQEKATYGKYKYVGTKKREELKSIPSKTILPKEAPVKRTIAKMETQPGKDPDISTRSEETTAKKKMSIKTSSTKKINTGGKPYVASKSTKKYFIKSAGGEEEEVSEDTKKKFPKRFK